MSCMARSIFLKCVKAVAPNQLVVNELQRHGNTLRLGEHWHTLDKNVYIIGFGKAVCGMCRAVQQLAGDHVVSGVLSIPTGLTISDLLPIEGEKIRIMEGAKQNLPDKDAVHAATKIIDVCNLASDGDLLIVLISGGGSALLPAPVPPVTLEDKNSIVKALVAKGATIQELNIVRQQLSLLKGGKLLKLAHPAKVWSLILSDIVGDPVDLIASGPTVKNQFLHRDALNVLERYQIHPPLSISAVLMRADDRRDIPTTVVNRVIGNNQHAVEAGLGEATRMGMKAIALSRTFQGEARQLGCALADLVVNIALFLETNDPIHAFEIKSSLQVLSSMSATTIRFEQIFDALEPTQFSGLCLIGAGETTVSFQCDPGLGGRNQEMVLAAALQIYKRLVKTDLKKYEVTFLSAGTDGQDGPTTAAGAVFTFDDIPTFDSDFALELLNKHDSHNFFKRGGSITTGLTGTNVMDIQILTVTPRSVK